LRKERGWVQAVWRDEQGAEIAVLYYCPDHAEQFNPEDPDVSPLES
jgi:hypothetical protein